MELISHTEKIHTRLEGDDPLVQVVNPYHPQFHVEPWEVTVEFDLYEPDAEKAVRHITVTGQRYRHMADGTFKRVSSGSSRRPADEPTVWSFPPYRGWQRERGLLKLVRSASLYRKVRVTA